MKRLRQLPLSLYIVAAMALGLLAGPWLGRSALPLGELGKLVIQLIKGVATPLLFLAIVHAILKTEIQARAGLRLLGFAAFNATLALGIGMMVSNTLQPGLHLLGMAGPAGSTEAYASKKLDLVGTLSSYIPNNLVTPFEDNVVISIVIIALLSGFGLRQVRTEGGEGAALVERGVEALLRLAEVVLGWVIRLIPLAVFGVVARTVGEYGYAPLKGLVAYVGAGLLGLVIHALLTYQGWLWLWVRIPLGRFWKEAREPIVTALGTNSSLATLPVTLRALDRLGVSKSASTLGACVGTNLNNDGIILYEGMAVLFVAQASGIVLTLPQQALAAATCIVAAMGVAGVPEAGFISLALVLNSVGLPLELLPLLLTVDWVIARGRSVVNVLSDMLLSILIDGRKG